MSLPKGFLSKKSVIKKERIISGLILWVLISYPLYAFFYMFRETFRILSESLGGRILLVLSNQETFVYNLFYASIAVSIGYMFSLKFVLENSTSLKPTRDRLFLRQVLNQQGFFTWTFLLWFSKVAGMLAIWYVTFPLQYDIDFLREAPLFLFLLPLVLFFSTWPYLRLALGINSLKWLGKSFIIFILLSLIFSFKNFLDIDAINKNLLKSSIEYNYNLQAPKSRSHTKTYHRSRLIDIYVAKDTSSLMKPVLFLKDIVNPFEIGNINRVLNMERDKLSEHERFNLVVNLHIDKNIKMGYVNNLKYEFRKNGINMIQFSTGFKNSKYPSNYLGFKYSGIQRLLEPRYYAKFEDFLDSAENLDLSKHKIRLSESQMYRIGSFQSNNRIEINVGRNETTLNGSVVSETGLEYLVYNFVKMYSPNFIILFNIEDQITYQRYIEFLDLVYYQIDKLRNEMSLELYGKSFNYWYRGIEIDSIKSKYPRNVVEWTKEEKRLLKLMKN